MVAFLGKKRNLWVVLFCLLIIFVLSGTAVSLCEKDGLWPEDNLWDYLPKDGDRHKYCGFSDNELNVVSEVITSRGDGINKINIEYRNSYTEFAKEPFIYIQELEVKHDRVVMNNPIIGEQILIKSPIRVGTKWKKPYLVVEGSGRRKTPLPEMKCEIVSLDQDVVLGKSVDVVDVRCITVEKDVYNMRIAKGVGIIRQSIASNNGSFVQKVELCDEGVSSGPAHSDDIF